MKIANSRFFYIMIPRQYSAGISAPHRKIAVHELIDGIALAVRPSGMSPLPRGDLAFSLAATVAVWKVSRLTVEPSGFAWTLSSSFCCEGQEFRVPENLSPAEGSDAPGSQSCG